MGSSDAIVIAINQVRSRGTGPMQIKQTLTFEVLQEHFHIPMSEVAKKFGVCSTVFKRMCRTHGIKRWPFRKLQSLERQMLALNESLIPLTTEETIALHRMTEFKAWIVATGTVENQSGDEGGEDDATVTAGLKKSEAAAAPSEAAEAVEAVEVVESFDDAHVMMDGCEIRITFAAVEQGCQRKRERRPEGMASSQ